MKRYLILIIIFFLLIAGFAIGVYLWLNTKNAKSSDAIQGIPIDASVIVKIDDFAKFKSSIADNRVWESISTIGVVSNTSSVFDFIDSLYSTNSLVKNLLNSNQLYISLNADGGNNSSFLFSIRVPDENNPSDIYSLTKLQAIGLYKEEEKYFNESLILTFKQNKVEFGNISVAIQNGLLLVSNSVLLLEKSLSQFDNNISLLNNPQFLAISKTSGSRVDANIFINIKRLPNLFKGIISSKYSNGVNSLGDIAQWVELDLILSSRNFVLSGLSSVSDSTNSYLRILSKQKPVDIEMPSILPVETGLFVWLGISNLDDYLEVYRSYLDRKGEIFKYTQNLSGYRKFLGVEVQEYFQGIINEEIGVAYLPASSNFSDDWYIVSKTKSASATAQSLQEVSDNYRKETGVDFSSKPIVIKVDKEKTIEVFHQPLKGFFNLLLGSLFAPVSDEYYCFIDNWIIFGSSPESLERYVKAFIRNNVLNSNNSYKQFNSELPQKANYFIFINPNLVQKVAEEFLVPKGDCVKNPLNNLQGISYQLIGGNNLLFNTLTITSGEEVQRASHNSIWETKLDAVPVSKPQIVLNHINKEKEIFVQDSENNIYLINIIGRILWKRKIDGPIMGEAIQIDIFKNKKLQLTFNTASKLYVIDRNGKDVDGFPVLYSTTATNPISVVDYDGSRDYRFFQACTDRRIYIYDSKGKPIKGWDFSKTESTVTDRIGFVRTNGLDYIIVFDSNRPYLLNRRGEERVNFKNHFGKAPNSQFSLATTSKGKLFIITTDTIGLIQNLYFDGAVDDIALKPFTRWHCFIYQDLTGDGRKDYIFLDNNTLYAFDEKKNALFQVKIKDELNATILYFDFGGDNKIGLFSEKSNKIYLINNKGKIADTFPYTGSTPFSIAKIASKKNVMNIIVGTKQGIVTNYELP